MSDVIWNDWLPGVLSTSQLERLIGEGYVRLGEGVSLDDAQYELDDGSSFDLHLTDEVYRLTSGSIKPFGDSYLECIKEDDLVERIGHSDTENGSKIFRLNTETTYLFRIREELSGLCDANFHGQATARSSIGRVDVLARLIVDGMTYYEGFTPEVLGAGTTRMYLEVTPITFPVRVKEGESLSQLRLFYGDPSNCELTGPDLYRTCFEVRDGSKTTDTLSVDLTSTEVYDGKRAVAFVADRDEQKDKTPIDLWDEGRAAPSDYWSREGPIASGRMEIEKNNFYILRSKEKIALTGGVAVYARAIDEAIGEMRIHYAGFAHPHFGRDRKDGKTGTPLIFEVRGHNIDVNLRDGETMARLNFYRMSQDVPKGSPKEYSNQTLRLSKYFNSEKWETGVDHQGQDDDNG